MSTLIVDQIKFHIIEGNLKPGDPLPSERELMKKFSVSRSSLREALKILDATGFVEIAQRKRTRVKSIVPDNFIEPIRPLLRNDVNTIIEVLDVRRCLETWNAYYASERATDGDIKWLQQNLKSMEEKISKKQSVIEDDAAFHLGVSAAAHNKIHTHLMYSIYALVQDTVGLCYETNESIEILKEHQKIFDAIKQKDKNLALEAMNSHLDIVLLRIKKFFDKKS
ncbi:MAG: FadR/GntR family transcriptional regulator [Pseudomonadota bacterium]